MKKVIALVMIIVTLFVCSVCLTGCINSDNECIICGGSGYYQKKDCPGC